MEMPSLYEFVNLWTEDEKHEFYVCGNHSVILTHSEIEDLMNRKYLVGVFLPTIFPLVGASNNFIPNKSRSLLWIRTK